MKKTIWILCMAVVLGTSLLFAGCSNRSNDDTTEKQRPGRRQQKMTVLRMMWKTRQMISLTEQKMQWMI